MPLTVKIRKVFEALSLLVIAVIIGAFVYEPTREYILSKALKFLLDLAGNDDLHEWIQNFLDWVVSKYIYF